MPMSVIRDTELLRKSRFIRAKKRFSASRLISTRQLKLHPTRQLGAAFLVMIMLICMILALNYALPELYRMARSNYAFSISKPWIYTHVSFADGMPRTVLTVQDIRQIASLDQVSYTSALWSEQVNLMMELDGEAPEYFRYGGGENGHLYPEDGFWSRHEREEYEIMREEVGIEEGKEAVVYRLTVLDDVQMKKLEGYVESGKIDWAAIDAGREVIAYAPDIWMEITYNEEGEETGYSSYTGDEDTDRYGQWNRKIENDAFYAGQELDVVQLFLYQDEAEQFSQSDDDFEEKVYSAAHWADASVTVGAVLTGGSLNDLEAEPAPSIITSFAGARAMGLTLGAPNVLIGLNGEVDLETEKNLEERIAAIAARGEGAYLFNEMEWYRENQQRFKSMLLVFICVTLVFFAVSVGIIAGNVSRRVRAESRMIGTLRAVGADAKAVAGCYVGQIAMSIAIGAAATLALYGWGLWFMYRTTTYTFQEYSGYSLISIASALLVATGCYACCRWSLSMRLRSVMARSIIENIREL